MASSFKLIFDGAPADDAFYTSLTSLEVEENVDLPGAFELHLPVSRDQNGEPAFASDPRLKPFANVAVVAMVDGKPDECIFDGFVLVHKLHLETGMTSSTLTAWGQDASWLMNLEEKVKEWVDVTDGSVANSIFGDYGISPAAENTNDDSAAHTESGHSLMQRGSDIHFLRMLARRNGKLARVACGSTPGERTGYFVKPKVDGDAALTLIVNDPENWNTAALDFEWDVSRPSQVDARQALFTDDSADGASVTPSDSGLTPLDAQGLEAFSGKPMKALLTTQVDDAGELQQRAEAFLRESGWFVRCEGETDAARLNAIPRAGTVVQIDGVGSLHSGKYFLWSVRHTITQNDHKMRLVLLRNAVGPAPSGGGGGLGGLL